MLKFLSFFKKEKTAPAESETKAMAIDETLSTIVYHVMPKKFINAAGNDGMHHTKKWGMFIVCGGGMMLVAGVVLLVWYIFFAPVAAPSAAVSRLVPSTAPSGATPSPAETATTTEQIPKSSVGEESVVADESEKDCGTTVLAESSDNAADDAALVCVGERIAGGCYRATANINTDEISSVTLSVLGLRQDSCLIQLMYPAVSAISDAALKDYANTYLRCPYNVADLALLNYAPAQLAQYVYAQSALENLTEGRNCEGSTFTLWLERDQRAAAAEENVASSSPSSLASGFVAGVDTDGDGLTDMEESAIFATSVAITDTDGDSYPDGTEVLNNYNPAGEGTLIASGLVARYENSQYGYNMSYPKNWRVEDAVNGDNVIFFSNQSGFIQVIAQTNAGKQGIVQWYESVNNTAPVDSAGKSTNAPEELKNGLEVVFSPDGLTAYLTLGGGGDYIYIVTYSPGENNKLEYRATFQMMVHALAQ